MEGRSLAQGFVRYLGWLVSAIVFPIAWARSLKLADRQKSADPRARVKVAAGIAIGVILFAGGVWQTWSFQQENTDGIYGSLDRSLSIAVGNQAYNDAVEAEDADAVAALEPNHALYLAVSAELDDRDDAGAKQAIADRGAVDFDGLDANAARAFEIKDRSMDQMHFVLTWLVYPGLVGLFYAPMVFALGNVAKHAYEQSGSVGFKPYPGGAAGWFLLLGGFGVPALPFSAWVFKDLDDRDAEGQIAL